MLPTFIIGLREGLEAALIVGLIAAFLRQRGQGLAMMWLGVLSAIALSIGVGVGLKLVEQGLPQARQEAMETVIGTIAVIFVTGMIVWMTRHAHQMKSQIHGDLDAALGQGSGIALALMAFLAVLREGFETAVFLLATVSAAQSGALAALGAGLGLALAVIIGWGIYLGGVRLNLGRFFRWTGAFLILVAAGLVMSALRTAHEAGWLLAGQQQVADLSWLVAPGSVQSALLTGVLGLPANLHLIEALGWLAYFVPVTAFVYWPKRWRGGADQARRIKRACAVALIAGAGLLAALYPRPSASVPDKASLIEADSAGTALPGATLSLKDDAVTLTLAGQTRSLPLSDTRPQHERHAGLAAQRYELRHESTPANASQTLSYAQLAQITGGRRLVGLSPARNPGPFTAHWTALETATLWTSHGALLDAQGKDSMLLRLSGGGLQTSRSLRLAHDPSGGPLPDWRVNPAQVTATARALSTERLAHIEFHFWARKLPIVMLLAALALLLSGARLRPLLNFKARSM
ncbi:iron permease [Thioclava dalianensis]|uniref:Iron permease n=1 Tax=Thioclava dalianensis TaxID=1185766 RepID=A0A074TQY4_9RHOB|nr:iron uptake transporter permease EfeU [Thioclava dalianensis]KEP71373.1 iron permease [Thioclava dalianensis]SFM78548.1 high-affinity iron transporter [Thioclava dalianensis]